MVALRRSEGGFGYLGLLFAVAIIGITLATVGVVWSTEIRRDKEADLLFAGDQIRAAIASYYKNGGSYPATLDDLVTDKRWPVPRRHLRRLFYDPMTASKDWQLILSTDGNIMGVASSSQLKPIKQANFSADDGAFEKTECYCDWQFVYQPRFRSRLPLGAMPGATQPAPGTPAPGTLPTFTPGTVHTMNPR